MIVTITLYLLYFLIIGLGVLFYYLNARLNVLTERLNEFSIGMHTLRENQDVLMSNIKKIHHEFRSNKKDIKKESITRRPQ